MIKSNKFPLLDFPTFEPKVRTVDNQVQIFDAVRRKYLVLTPEEWVRQHVVQYLIHQKSVAPSLIKLEYQVKMRQMLKRPDVAVVHPKGYTWLIVECKAPSVTIDKNVFDQALNYFTVEKPHFMLLTNGISHYYFEHKPNENKIVVVHNLPNFDLN